jgi:hypothetical protein
LDRRTFRLFGLTLVVLVVVVAVAATLAGGTTRDPDAPRGEQAVGVVTAVDAASLTDVRGFDLRTQDGRDLAFRIGVLENGAEFPPGHLGEHQRLRTLIRVWYRTEGAELVAFRLEDAE